VLVFFRGRWCPFCVTQLEMLNQWLPEFRQPGATLVGMSPQTVHQSYLMHNQHRLGFPLLGDAQNAVARQFGLVYRVPDYLEELYRRSFVNLPFANGDPSWELPLAATYVVDRTGTVLFAFASADYTERAEPQDVARVVREAARN
jgi:peroxiredoxin